MLSLVRLTTIHPILVHFTIGALPVMLLAYAIGAFKHDERWTFVGDVAAGVTALVTLATLAFGLVSNFTLDWPGSLETYRWAHLILGGASTVLLGAFAVSRMVRRRRAEKIARGGTVAAAGLVALTILAAGWVGGEVLVYRSGMAVVAAGDGALAQPTSKKPAHARNIPEAMDAVQAAWGSSNAAIAGMVVRRPTAAAFRDIERDAQQLQQVAAWMESDGAKQVHGDTEAFVNLSRTLHDRAADLESAARANDVQKATDALGAIAGTCAGCHAADRWRRPPAPQAAR